MGETNEVMKPAMLALSRAGAVVFRHNVAQGVVGAVEWIKGLRRQVWVSPGDAVVRGARVLHAGLINGGSDLIGWRSVVVTQEMVGKRIAVFLAVETKAETGRKRTEQETFVKNVSEAGGIAGFAYTADEAVALLQR